MADSSSNNKRIAKNTIMLYARMIIFMVVSLYTSRVVLNSLGVEDFGVYNVVTGFVIAFGFLNSAMNASVQRFLTVEFKSDYNVDRLNKIFNMSIMIHLILALLMVAIAEPIGVYFVSHKLVIPPDRMQAAMWIFHLSVLSLFFNIMNVPYRALIVTHEDMGAFALISLFEVFAKLAVAVLIAFVLFDKLIFYGLLLAGVAVLVQIFYMIYCITKYKKEVSFQFFWERKLFNEMCSFAGWNLIGVFAGIAYNQGVNIVLNLFGGPVVNAARAIAFQVSGAANQLVTNFQMAVNPPIMKSYVAKDGKAELLVYSSSKISALLLLFIAIPAIAETPYILQLWLKTVPDYTVAFTRLALVDAIVCSMAGPLHTLFQATGNIKRYQLIISSILLLNLPISYVFLKLGCKYEVTIIIAIVLSLLAIGARLRLVTKFAAINLCGFLYNVAARVVCVSFICCILLSIPMCVLNEGFTRLLAVVLTSTISLCLGIFVFGLDKKEKSIVIGYVNKIKGKK